MKKKHIKEEVINVFLQSQGDMVLCSNDSQGTSTKKTNTDKG